MRYLSCGFLGGVERKEFVGVSFSSAGRARGRSLMVRGLDILLLHHDTVYAKRWLGARCSLQN